MNKKTTSICVGSFACALQKANDILGPDRPWTPTTDPTSCAWQKRAIIAYLNITDDGRRDMTSIEGIDGEASFDHEKLNATLQKFGVDIRLDPFLPTEFGTIGLYEVGRDWLIEGNSDISIRLADGGRKVPGFRIPNNNRKRALDVIAGLEGNPTVRFYTKQPRDRCVVIMRDDGEYDDFELHERAVRMEEESREGESIACVGVQVPMVDLNHQPDISRLIGLSTHKEEDPLDRFYIGQALQQNIFQMDHMGFLAKSATALGLLSGAQRHGPPPPDYIVDGPFIVAVVADYGVEFAAHIWPDTMRDPKRTYTLG